MHLLPCGQTDGGHSNNTEVKILKWLNASNFHCTHPTRDPDCTSNPTVCKFTETRWPPTESHKCPNAKHSSNRRNPFRCTFPSAARVVTVSRD